MINNRQQSGRRRGRGGQNGQRQQNGRPDMGNRIDNRARGNAAQLLEKYKTLAADAQRSGDRVLAEYYLQFADHYFRVLAESRARYEEANPGRARQDYGDSDSEGFDGETAEGEGEEGYEARERQPQRPERQDRYQRDDRPRNDQNRDERQDRQPREDRGPRQDREPRQDRYQRDDRPREDRPQRDDRPQREERPRLERAPREDGESRRPRARTNGSGAAHDDEPSEGLPFDALPPAIGVTAMEPVAGVEGEPVEMPKRRGRPKKVVEASDGE